MDMNRYFIRRGMKVRPARKSGPDAYLEWLKWLSYIPEYEKNKLEELKTKKLEDLSNDELEFLLKNKENKRIKEKFEKVIKKEGTTTDELMVYDYTKTHNINDLMLSKLTKEELEYAKDKITECTKTLSKKELKEKIDTESKDEIYKDLSMVYAYILNVLAGVNFIQSLRELDKEIEIAHRQNDYMLIKSIENASKRY